MAYVEMQLQVQVISWGMH